MVIMRLKHKNDDYYTISNDNNTMLNEEPSANNKLGKVNKFMIAIVIWVLGACAILCPIAAYSYYKTHSMFIWPIIMLGLVLYIMLSLFFLVVYFSDKKYIFPDKKDSK